MENDKKGPRLFNLRTQLLSKGRSDYVLVESSVDLGKSRDGKE